MHPFPKHLPVEEMELRQRRTGDLLSRLIPSAEGLLVFSRLNIYYLTGTAAAGVLWLPLEGKAVLLCRRGEARARLESPLPDTASFRSFREIPSLLSAAGSPLGAVVGAETRGLSWALSTLLQRNLPGTSFLPGDGVLSRARSLKSEWELERLRDAGSRHALCMESLLPPLIEPGMTEARIAHRVWEVFFGQGHQGLLRMEGFGEEIFLGHVAAGESANHPSVMNGPVGLRGVHPAAPFMGSPEVTWRRGEPLVIDAGFGLEGYQTDRTQVYWSGPGESVPDSVRRAHDFCIAIQERLAGGLVPGALPSELARQAFQSARREGWEEGFMALGGNKVPFVGHGIGLAIDEFPPLAEGFDEPLEEGMVVALEPKIGLSGIGMAGVENTFEVTPRGGRCLTGSEFGLISVSSR